LKEGISLEIAAAVVALLSPYLAQAGGILATKAGEGVAALVGDLYSLVRDRFDADPDAAARGALRNLEKQPADDGSQRALQAVLAEKATADPAFADELAGALQRITQGTPVNQQFLTQVYGGEVGNIINVAQAGDLYFN
jgi:hypothetical protein